MKVLIILSFILCSATAYSDTDSASKDVEKVLSYLPESIRTKLDDYLKMIGISSYDDPSWVGEDNEGLRGYNDQLLGRNRCLSKLAEDFYKELPKTDIKTGFLKSDFSINYQSENPGWLLRYANTKTKGNGNLAVTLLGLCGHDNAASSVSTFNGGKIYCPKNMFAPQALGSEFNIEKSLIDKVTNIQSPNMGAKALPAKSYHILASAYQTCSLVKNGVPGLMASKIQNKLIYTYRIKRLCEKKMIGNYNFEHNRLGRLFKSEDLSVVREKLLREAQLCKDKIESDECQDLTSLLSEDDIIDGNIKAINSGISRLAEFYFAHSLMHENIKNNDLCSNIQMTHAIYKKLDKISKDNRLCGDLSPDQCEIGQRIISTWTVDIEWSESQHFLGSKIARESCSTKNIDLEEAACSLVD